MHIIGAMGNKDTTLIRKYVRTTKRIRSVLKGLVNDLGVAPAFSRRRYALSEEVVVSAMWLMLRDRDTAELAEALAPYVAKVETVFAEVPENDGQAGDVGSRFGLPTDHPPNPEPKRRSG